MVVAWFEIEKRYNLDLDNRTDWALMQIKTGNMEHAFTERKKKSLKLAMVDAKLGRYPKLPFYVKKAVA
jgi:hypothetical protein